MSARSLRWVRDVLSRSIQLQQRRGQAPSASEARRGEPVDPEVERLMEQRADLGARLLVHDPQTQTVRNLFVVRDELGTRGWAGVEALAPAVVGRALTEAEILATQEPSPPLTTIIETLRSIQVRAEARVARQLKAAIECEWECEKPMAPEVSETDYDEYELMERSWVGTVPAGLDLSERAP